MATEKQISANRANAEKSTGPKTTAGRAAVRLNALRHGLAAESIVIEDEDKAQFEESRAAFEAEHNPVGPTENLLVHQMIVAAWRLRRTRAMSAGFIENMMGDAQIRQFGEFDNASMSVRLGYVAAGHIDRLDLLARYESRIERTFYRALHELERLRNVRADPDSSPEPLLPNKPNSPLPPGDAIGGTSLDRNTVPAKDCDKLGPRRSIHGAYPSEIPRGSRRFDCAVRSTDTRLEDLHELRYGGLERHLHARTGLVLGERRA